ncbi:Protein COBRA like [Actinidia chinensis var. chinensis]|uniref:Protein COBRA like n=1 Tax=Actinidia chinensis var. chinensis TaxID=1590841 RepID=A0A2R6RUF7_ACTCC|nr:Protein COBRA like [Actinidia chinensis var. chinensis]
MPPPDAYPYFPNNSSWPHISFLTLVLTCCCLWHSPPRTLKNLLIGMTTNSDVSRKYYCIQPRTYFKLIEVSVFWQDDQQPVSVQSCVNWNKLHFLFWW